MVSEVELSSLSVVEALLLAVRRLRVGAGFFASVASMSFVSFVTPEPPLSCVACSLGVAEVWVSASFESVLDADVVASLAGVRFLGVRLRGAGAFLFSFSAAVLLFSPSC